MGARHLFLPRVERDERLVRQWPAGWVTLVVCDYYFTVLFGAEPITVTVRKCRLRGLFHCVFDVGAAREKVGQVRTVQCHRCLGRILDMVQSYFTVFFPVRIIVFTVVHSCNCLASFFIIRQLYGSRLSSVTHTACVQCDTATLYFLHTGL